MSLWWFTAFLVAFVFLVTISGSPSARAEQAQETTTQETASQNESASANDESATECNPGECDQESPPPEKGNGQSEEVDRDAQPVAAPESVVAGSVSTKAKPDSKSNRSKSKTKERTEKVESPSTLVSSEALPKEKTAAEPSTGSLSSNGGAGSIQKGKRLLAGIALVLQKQSEVLFRARVDTGARLCSIHADELVIEDSAESMAENIGKMARIRLTNRKEESGWLKTQINCLVRVDTSDHTEQRYSVPLVLVCHGVEKEVQVTLNDRSKMSHPLLLGRNFLHGDFIVDIEITDPD